MRNWIPILIIAGLLVVWIGGMYLLIGDRAPAWDYGATPYIPGASAFSTNPPPAATANPPEQIPAIPPPPTEGKRP